MYTSFYSHPDYIKKEDAMDLLRRRKIFGVSVSIAVAIVFTIMEFMVAPRLTSMYQEFGITLPLYAQSQTRYVLVLMTIMILFLIKPESEEEIVRKLRNYSPGEMILLGNLINRRYELTVFYVLVGSVLGIILTVILPIYSMTAQF